MQMSRIHGSTDHLGVMERGKVNPQGKKRIGKEALECLMRDQERRGSSRGGESGGGEAAGEAGTETFESTGVVVLP
jgi:hypothetical protein